MQFSVKLRKMLTNDSSDEIDDRVKRKYASICEQLDIDESIIDQTWDNYRSIRNDHTLEVSEKWKIHLLNVDCIRDESDAIKM